MFSALGVHLREALVHLLETAVYLLEAPVGLFETALHLSKSKRLLVLASCLKRWANIGNPPRR